MGRIVRFLMEEDGPTAVEYAVMLALILMAVITSVSILGTTTAGIFSDTAANMNGT